MYSFSYRGSVSQVSESFYCQAAKAMDKYNKRPMLYKVSRKWPPENFDKMSEGEQFLYAVVHLSSVSVYKQIIANVSKYSLDAVTLKAASNLIASWTGKRPTLAVLRTLSSYLANTGFIRSHLANPETELFWGLRYYPSIKTLSIYGQIWQHYTQ